MAPRLYLLVFMALLLLPSTALAGGRTLVVAPDGTHRSIGGALGEAANGDTVLVRGGIHAGPVTVTRSVRLIGEGNPVLDGAGEGTVLRIAAPGVEVRGFVVRATGDSLDQEHAGIYVEAPDAIITQNRLEDVLFGIYLKGAPRSLVESNTIMGKQLAPGLIGDGIRLWNSGESRVAGNEVRRTRQVIIQHSERTLVERNTIVDGLMGIHLMVSPWALVEGNEIRTCDVGIFAMYGTNLTVRANLIANSRGPSGYGLGLKDVDDSTIEENRITGNRTGVYLDNSPRRGGGGENLIRQNLLAGNDRALLMQPSVSGNTFTANSFIDNLQNLQLPAGGQPVPNRWSYRGVGNYWSDYAGYDGDGDGVGDLPYRPQSLYETMAESRPVMRWFLAGPAAVTVDLAARILPAVAGEPRIDDAMPLVRPVLPAPGGPGPGPAEAGPLAAPLALLGASACLASLGLVRRNRL